VLPSYTTRPCAACTVDGIAIAPAAWRVDFDEWCDAFGTSVEDLSALAQDCKRVLSRADRIPRFSAFLRPQGGLGTAERIRDSR
jgi:hypothetical protein